MTGTIWPKSNLERQYKRSPAAGIRRRAETAKFAAIAADSSYFGNHLQTSVPPSAEPIGTGMAYSQVPRMVLSANWMKSGRLASPTWPQATAIAPRNTLTRQLTKIAGETGIGTLAMSSATRAAKKGWRLIVAEMMIGCALLSPSLNSNNPAMPKDLESQRRGSSRSFLNPPLSCRDAARQGTGHQGSIGYEHTRNAQTRSGRRTPSRHGGHGAPLEAGTRRWRRSDNDHHQAAG